MNAKMANVLPESYRDRSIRRSRRWVMIRFRNVARNNEDEDEQHAGGICVIDKQNCRSIDEALAAITQEFADDEIRGYVTDFEILKNPPPSLHQRGAERLAKLLSAMSMHDGVHPFCIARMVVFTARSIALNVWVANRHSWHGKDELATYYVFDSCVLDVIVGRPRLPEPTSMQTPNVGGA